MQHKILTTSFYLLKDKIDMCSLYELFNSATCSLLSDERHGCTANQKNKRGYSDFVYNVVKTKNKLTFNFSSLVDQNYKILTEAILTNKFNLGNIRVGKTSISMKNNNVNTNEPVFIRGIVSLNKKEGKKKVFKDIKDDDFMSRLELNLFAKTSAFIGRKHNFIPKFEIAQLGKSHMISYKQIGYLAHDVILKATLDETSANILFHAGIGSYNARGIGFMTAVQR
jgi:CRISPR/Cas system endoribonuclease Cas6 (RAMP superfamily)